jgi:hypothetical protein
MEQLYNELGHNNDRGYNITAQYNISPLEWNRELGYTFNLTQDNRLLYIYGRQDGSFMAKHYIDNRNFRDVVFSNAQGLCTLAVMFAFVHNNDRDDDREENDDETVAYDDRDEDDMLSEAETVVNGENRENDNGEEWGVEWW